MIRGNSHLKVKFRASVPYAIGQLEISFHHIQKDTIICFVYSRICQNNNAIVV